MAVQLLAVLALVLLLIGWIAVQRAWQRAFGAGMPDDDALAARGGCEGCSCHGGRCRSEDDDAGTEPAPDQTLRE
jgi:hypothetical protein